MTLWLPARNWARRCKKQLNRLGKWFDLQFGEWPKRHTKGCLVFRLRLGAEKSAGETHKSQAED